MVGFNARDDSRRLNSAIKTNSVVNSIHSGLSDLGIEGIIVDAQFTRSDGQMDWDYQNNAVGIRTSPEKFRVTTGSIDFGENAKGSDMNDPRNNLGYLLPIAQNWFGVQPAMSVDEMVSIMYSDYDVLMNGIAADNLLKETYLREVPAKMLAVLKEAGLADNEELLRKALDQYASEHIGKVHDTFWMHRFPKSRLVQGFYAGNGLTLRGQYSPRQLFGESKQMQVRSLELSGEPNSRFLDVEQIDQMRFKMTRHINWYTLPEGKDPMGFYQNGDTQMQTSLSVMGPPLSFHVGVSYLFPNHYSGARDEAKTQRILDVFERGLGIKFPEPVLSR